MNRRSSTQNNITAHSLFNRSRSLLESWDQKRKEVMTNDRLCYHSRPSFPTHPPYAFRSIQHLRAVQETSTFPSNTDPVCFPQHPTCVYSERNVTIPPTRTHPFPKPPICSGRTSGLEGHMILYYVVSYSNKKQHKRTYDRIY